MEKTVLYCYQELIMEPDAIEDKEYEVVDETNRTITIRNEHGELHNFSKDINDEAYFGNWFWLIRK